MTIPGTEKRWSVAHHAAMVRSAHPWILMPLALSSIVASAFHALTALWRGELSLSGCACLFFITAACIDLISGVFHICLDNPYFAQGFGPMSKMCQGFQQHHINTSLIFRMSLEMHLRPFAVPVLSVYAIGGLVHGFREVWSASFVCIALALLWMQMGHRWAHLPSSERSGCIQKLQDLGMMLHPRVHQRHHNASSEPRYQTDFCLMWGAANPLLNWLVASHPLLHPHSTLWLPLFLAITVLLIVVLPSVYACTPAYFPDTDNLL